MRPTKIYEQIIEIEKEFDLFNKKFNNIYFWKLVRLSIWSYLLKEYGFIQSMPTRIKNKSFIEKIHGKYEVIKNSILYSSFISEEKDILIFENPRKISYMGTYIDPYTDDFVNKINNQNVSYEIVDEGYRGVYYNPADNNRRYSVSFYYDAIYPFIKRFKKSKLIPEENYFFIDELEEILEKKFHKKIPLRSIVIRNVNRFLFQYKKYKVLFIKKRPKVIYIVCSYGKEGLIHAAKEQNIEVVELQHGVMDKISLGYSFEVGKNIPYFPDRLLLFGKYWSDSTPLPLPKEKVEVVGYNFFNRQFKKYKEVEKIKNRVMIISQWPIGKELSEKAVEIALENREYEIVYRLHPQEIENWENSYSILYENKNIPNLTIDNSNSDLYEQLAKSKYIIGVYSMVIFESLSLDCKVLLLNLYGIEYMDYLIKNEYVMVHNIEDKIDIELIENTNTISKEYIFGGGE